MSLKEQFILARIRNGDIRAFENVFHRHYSGMCRYAVSLLKKEDLAEEVVQDVFYNVWKNRKSLNIDNLQAYLYRSVYNNSMMMMRRMKKEVRLDEEWAEGQLTTSPGPEQSIDKKEMDELILKTLNTLPERTREIFTLNRYEGLKYRDIALKLSISVKTVEANMGKALKALRTNLEEYGV